MFTGLTLATVLGVPFGTFIGDRFGWHTPFALIALLGIVSLISIWVLVPHVAYEVSDLRAELRALVSGRLALALATTMLGFAGVFTLFTYIAPLLEMLTHFSAATVLRSARALRRRHDRGQYLSRSLRRPVTSGNPL